MWSISADVDSGKVQVATFPRMTTAVMLHTQDLLLSERRKSGKLQCCSVSADEYGGNAAIAGFPPLWAEEKWQTDLWAGPGPPVGYLHQKMILNSSCEVAARTFCGARLVMGPSYTYLTSQLCIWGFAGDPKSEKKKKKRNIYIYITHNHCIVFISVFFFFLFYQVVALTLGLTSAFDTIWGYPCTKKGAGFEWIGFQ